MKIFTDWLSWLIDLSLACAQSTNKVKWMETVNNRVVCFQEHIWEHINMLTTCRWWLCGPTFHSSYLQVKSWSIPWPLVASCRLKASKKKSLQMWHLLKECNLKLEHTPWIELKERYSSYIWHNTTVGSYTCILFITYNHFNGPFSIYF